jgi:hypothetical protein
VALVVLKAQMVPKAAILSFHLSLPKVAALAHLAHLQTTTVALVALVVPARLQELPALVLLGRVTMVQLVWPPMDHQAAVVAQAQQV